jgi:hypothetical protein
MINNELPRQSFPQEAPYLGPVCFHCSCGIPEYLVACVKCSSSFCYRRVEDEDSEDGEQDEYPNDQPQEPGDEEEDKFPFHEACIAFNIFSANSPRPSLEDSKQQFLCPDCWDHATQGLYPVSICQRIPS